MRNKSSERNLHTVMQGWEVNLNSLLSRDVDSLWLLTQLHIQLCWQCEEGKQFWESKCDSQMVSEITIKY